MAKVLEEIELLEVRPCGFLRAKNAVKNPMGTFKKNRRFIKYLPSQSLTWNLKMAPWNSRFLLETIIFRFHIKFGECTKG